LFLSVIAIIQSDAKQDTRFHRRKQLHHLRFAVGNLEGMVNIAGEIEASAAGLFRCIPHIAFLG
jgi:hypothetical protein